MIRLRLLAVGRVRERSMADLCGHYLKRIERYAEIEQVEVKDRGRSGGPPAQIIEREGEDLLKRLDAPQELCIALAVGGRQRTSEDLSRWLVDAPMRGFKRATLVIGGPHGLSRAVLARCREQLSLSTLTLPHELARVVLLEQLYRACSIERGLPYHNAGQL